MPLALAVMAGASLLTAAPATAAVGITILTPTEGATLDSHVQIFTGVTVPNASVTATLGQVTLPVATADANGDFAIEVAFANTQTALQTVTFAGTAAGAALPPATRTVNVTLIEPTEIDDFTPFDDYGFSDEDVTVRGSGRPGFIATVRITPIEPPAATPVQVDTLIDADGRWEVTAHVSQGGHRISSWHSEELSTGEPFMVSGASEQWILVVDFPAPVIIAATVSTQGVARISGTGTPGQEVQVNLTSARLREATEASSSDYVFDESDYVSAATRAVVDPAGNWAIDIALSGPNTYYASALFIDPTGQLALSATSAEFRFSYAAPAAQLAATGVEPAPQLGLVTLLLLIGGGALLLAHRRKESASATTGIR